MYLPGVCQYHDINSCLTELWIHNWCNQVYCTMKQMAIFARATPLPINMANKQPCQQPAGIFKTCYVSHNRKPERVLGSWSLAFTEWFRLEGILKIIQFQPPCNGQGHLPLDQVAQSLILPGFVHFQEWGINNFSGQIVPVSHHPLSYEFPPNL